ASVRTRAPETSSRSSCVGATLPAAIQPSTCCGERAPIMAPLRAKWLSSKSRSLARNRVEDLLGVAHPESRCARLEHGHRVLVIEDAAAGLDAEGWPHRGPDQDDIVDRRPVTEVPGRGLDERGA